MTRLRLAFMGTPDFALPCLEALAAAGHEIGCIYTQPPRPAGRGHRARPSPVQALAEARGWQVRTPVSLKNPTEEAAFAALDLDAAVVVAYGLILPAPMLAAPRLGCLNLHASLLPRWRGAAPIQRAILAGDRETGVTIMQVDQGLDTGPILLQEAVPIGSRSTAQELHDDLARLGADLMVQALEGLDQGRLAPRPQPDQGATYAAKLGRSKSRLDWRLSAAELDRRVRAFSPWPGAVAALPGPKGPEAVKVLAVEALALRSDAVPGTLLDDDLTIACGAGALRLLRVQRPGKAPLEAAAFLRGFPLKPGARLPTAENGP
jgi:methionyl-tRNA formyltransferase